MRQALAALAALVLLPALLAGCFAADPDGAGGQMPDRITIATGDTTGIYHGYGLALAEVLTERYGVEVEVLQTGGSVDNLQLVDDGVADVAFSAADAVTDAVAGEGAFDEPVEVQALARLYDDFAHLVVPAGSSVRTVADLPGLRVSVGAPRSGTSLIAGRVLEAAEVPASDLDVAEMGITESLEKLQGGDLDAVFWSGGLRTPGVVRLAEEMPIALVPLGGVVDSMRTEFGHGYRHGVVPDGVYGIRSGVETLAVPNLLVVSSDLPAGVAYGLTETLFEARGAVSETVPSAALLDRSRAIYTEPADLHAGAQEYYRATKP